MKIRGFFVLPLLCSSYLAMADDIPTFELSIQDHHFNPTEITVPARQKVKLLVSNKDRTPEEFESYELGREKIISGGRQAVIYIGPLAPGRYPFFGEFHPDTAKGFIIAK